MKLFSRFVITSILAISGFAVSSLAQTTTKSDLSNFSKNYLGAYLAYLSDKKVPISSSQIDALKQQNLQLQNQIQALQVQLNQLLSQPSQLSQADLARVSQLRQRIGSRLDSLYRFLDSLDAQNYIQLDSQDKPPLISIGIGGSDVLGKNDFDNSFAFSRMADKVDQQLRNLIDQNTREVNDLQREIERLQAQSTQNNHAAEINQLRREMDEQEQDMAQAQSSLKSALSRLEDLRREMDNPQGIVAQIDQLERQLTTMNLAGDTDIGRLEQAKARLQNLLSNPPSSGTISGQTLQQLNNGLKNLKTRQSALASEKSILCCSGNTPTVEQQARIEAIDAELVALTVKLDEIRTQIQQLSAEQQGYDSQVTAAKGEVASLELKVQQFQKQVQSLISRIQELENRLHQLPNLIREQEQVIEQRRSEIDRARMNIDSLARRIQDLENDSGNNDFLDDQINSLRVQAEALKAANAALVDNLRRVDSEVASIRSIRASINEIALHSTSTETPQTAALRNQIAQLQSQIDNNNQMISSLQSGLSAKYKNLIDWENYVQTIVKGTIKE